MILERNFIYFFYSHLLHFTLIQKKLFSIFIKPKWMEFVVNTLISIYMSNECLCNLTKISKEYLV